MLLEPFIEASPDGIAIIDQEGCVIGSNRGFEEMFGFAAGDIVGERLQALIVPEDLRDEGDELARRTLGGRFELRETERLHRDGRRIPVAVFGVPFRLESGELGALAFYRDIGEKRRAEEALRRSEAKYRTIFEESKDVIYITTPEGKILEVNPAGIELFEYGSLDEMLALSTAEDFFVEPEDHERQLSLVREQGFVRDLELRMKTKSGRVLTVLDTCIGVHDEEGELVALRGFLRDVTRQRELEEQLRQAVKMEALGRLAGGVAHDFNNLLMVIGSYCTLLESRIGVERPERQDLDEIRRACARAAALTRHLLAFSRKQVLSPRRLSLNEIVAETSGLLRRAIGEDVELKMDLAENLRLVRADRSQLEQVLVNLAVNSRDAMLEGGTLLIATSNVDLTETDEDGDGASRVSPWVRLIVSDTGVGIDEELRERVFEPFFTTKEVGSGSGLGLSSVYGVVQQSGGFIELSSSPGNGATFVIYLPAAREEEAVEPTSESATVLPTGEERILLVEDEEAVRRPLCRFLEHQGYTVHEADDGARALEISREIGHRVDLLVTDIVMPRLGGVELANELAREIPGLRVLFISGYSRGAGPECTGPANSAFLQKPFSPAALIRVVRDLLDRD